MFNNIERKLKSFAKLYFWVSVAGTFVITKYVNALFYYPDEGFLYTSTVFIASIIIAYFCSALIYALGELIETNKEIANAFNSTKDNSKLLTDDTESENAEDTSEPLSEEALLNKRLRDCEITFDEYSVEMAKLAAKE